VLANSSKDKHFNTIFTMTATVRDLITVLEMFFPGELPLKRAIYILVAVTALYPILRLHTNQVMQPRQPRMTAWLKSIGVLLMRAFHPEELDPDLWANHGPGQHYAENMHQDINVLYRFLGFNDGDGPPTVFLPKLRPIICTTRISCIICPQELQPHTLRQRTKMQSVRVLDANLTWVDGDLFVAHCPVCRSDYYPDRITYRTADNERMQKLEYDAIYIRISKHGIWAHRRIALAQEKALLRFHSGWSNFADWINETIGGGSKMTYRQSQRLFIENFSRRLLVAHEKEAAFACPAHPSAHLLAEHVRDIVGRNGGSMTSSMVHGCMDCTHRKRYRADLIDEGAILGDNVGGIAVADDDDEHSGDEVNMLIYIEAML
jgi:CxC5 like cysteine cluster associated with KDZ transposases